MVQLRTLPQPPPPADAYTLGATMHSPAGPIHGALPTVGKPPDTVGAVRAAANKQPAASSIEHLALVKCSSLANCHGS
jgi:hypothetical protein